MRKLLKKLLVAALALAIFSGVGILNKSLFPGNLTGPGETVALAAESKVTTTSLNLRSGPGLDRSIILTMPQGALVTVLSSSGEWSSVNYNGTAGYAFSTYLKASAGTLYATISSVNLRTGPGTGYSIIRNLPGGEIVKVNSIANNWASLSYNGLTGYSYVSYLTKGTEYSSTASVNLRTGPGTGNAIVLTIPSGKTVRVFSTANNWAHLAYNGLSGYSSLSYLKPASATIPTPSPPSAGVAKKIFKGITASTGKRIAITFDDGATSTNVNRVLDILDTYHAKSTFFFTGEWILANPITARKIVSRGHKLESHTVTHPFLTTLTDAQVRYQLNRSREIIKDTVGTTSYLLRPPYGDISDRILRLTGEAGYKYMVMWSVDTDDYKSTTSAAEIVQRAVAGAYNNGILLFHPSHDKVVTALPEILRQLSNKGYSFTTVNAMVP